jgi:hypothetical protein
VSDASQFNRRHLMSAALAGVAASPQACRAEDAPADGFVEPERTIPLVEDCDGIVSGAGPVGVSAAITAARA